MTDILNPVQRLKIGAEEIAVREMNWRDGTSFLQRLAIASAAVLDKEGNFTPDAASFASLVSNSTELIQDLILGSTGRDQAWLEERTMAEVMALLDLALALNLNADLIQRGKSLADRVRGAFGHMTPNP